ncbi:threonine aldolase family protein [Streptomyces sp. NPDC088354]|uniref:threonine aldolase family protein n=1 Tax=unclassified Streptomyces TaxID=2593676 RepID=UPI0029BF28F2|nr:aminotransferase class I/II-fold pyridoxal phosphate-dependent enzyme [Streptomyces sp. MI02-7b]MDX3076553.1 beta-eliminating lyase-related protein [Streptomyces sp. MI02-7b]
MTSADDEKARRIAAVNACDRVLSHGTYPTMRDRLARLAARDGLDGPTDMYGDGIVAEVEQRVARLLGTEEAVWFPTGTMAQQVALRCWAGRTGNPTVALHPLAHPERHERGALSALSGLRTVHPTTARRLPDAQEIRELDEPFGTLMLELPLRDAGFVLPSWEDLTATVEAARERDAVVHFDGARLWECPPHFGKPLEEIAGLADSVYVSFYKSLGGVAGAALAAPSALAAEARAWRHRYGGLLFQQWPTVLAALDGLDRELPRLPEYVAHAKTVAAALRRSLTQAGWARVHPDVPHTHQFQVWLLEAPEVLNEAGVRQAEETRNALFGRWSAGEAPGTSMTEVTVAASALEWDADDVAGAVDDFLGYVREVRKES